MILMSSFHTVVKKDEDVKVIEVAGDDEINHIVVQVRNFSEDVSHMQEIKDSDVLNGCKALMPADLEALPYAVGHDAKNTISRNTEDKAGQEAGYRLALIL
ncbi:unnamed protein product [Brassica rapa]|uniref:Uncharacterized protein n=1 Tax=Brassica campestris TaxID=3711 RepID=A0A8D9GBV2_BRACM|nr:unnamed protein product [Brassica rapa]